MHSYTQSSPLDQEFLVAGHFFVELLTSIDWQPKVTPSGFLKFIGASRMGEIKRCYHYQQKNQHNNNGLQIIMFSIGKVLYFMWICTTMQVIINDY